MRKTIDVIESHWLELCLLVCWVITIAISNLVPNIGDLPMRIGALSTMFLYLLRILTSFSHWKFSRGIWAILFMLNFLLFTEVETISIFFYGKVGFEQLIMVTNLGAELSAIPILVIFFSRYNKRKIYWQHLGITFIIAVIGFLICNVLKFL